MRPVDWSVAGLPDLVFFRCSSGAADMRARARSYIHQEQRLYVALYVSWGGHCFKNDSCTIFEQERMKNVQD